VDVTRAAGHLGFDRQRRATLPHLEPGMFYAYGPAISRRPVLVRTGAVQTTHPAPGAIVPPAPPPPIEMRALLAQLADLPTPESLVADDQARARARIAELEGHLERALAERPPERVVEYLPIIPDGQLDQLGSIADRLAAAAESAAHAATAIRDAVAAAQATPSLAPAVEPAHAPPGDAIDDIVDWDRLLDLPAVAAKIAQAQAGLTDGAGGYVPRVLRACLIAPLSPDELAEAWGLRGKSTQGRVRRAAQALITVRLLADTGDGRLAVNRGELERLGRLAAMVGEAGAARVPKER